MKVATFAFNPSINNSPKSRLLSRLCRNTGKYGQDIISTENWDWSHLPHKTTVWNVFLIAPTLITLFWLVLQVARNTFQLFYMAFIEAPMYLSRADWNTLEPSRLCIEELNFNFFIVPSYTVRQTWIWFQYMIPQY